MFRIARVILGVGPTDLLPKVKVMYDFRTKFTF